MPPDHGVGLHDQERVAPAVEELSHEDPEDPIAVLDSCPFRAALEYHDLLAKGDVLEGKSRSVSEQAVDESEEVRDPEHRDILTQDYHSSRLGHVCPFEAVWVRVWGRG